MDGNLIADTTNWVKGKDYPEWMDEVGVATISKGYLLPDETPRKAYRRVAKAIAIRINRPDLENKFFKYIWNGWIGLASPFYLILGPIGACLSLVLVLIHLTALGELD